jgi:hypothetical protein
MPGSDAIPVPDASEAARDLQEGSAKTVADESAGPCVQPSREQRVVLRDRHWPGRSFDTVDQVVVAPTGIFVIDVVGWSGPVEVTPDLLEVNGRSRQTAVTSAHETAREVALLLAPDMRDHVYPVICLSRDEDLSGWVKAVRICSASTMDDLIDNRDVVLSEDEIAQISSELDAALISNQPSPAERSRATDLGAASSTSRSADGRGTSATSWHRTVIGRVALGTAGLVLGSTAAFLGLHMTVLDTADDTPSTPHHPVGSDARD